MMLLPVDMSDDGLYLSQDHGRFVWYCNNDVDGNVYRTLGTQDIIRCTCVFVLSNDV